MEKGEIQPGINTTRISTIAISSRTVLTTKGADTPPLKIAGVSPDEGYTTRQNNRELREKFSFSDQNRRCEERFVFHDDALFFMTTEKGNRLEGDRNECTRKGAGGLGQGGEAAMKSGRKTVHGDP